MLIVVGVVVAALIIFFVLRALSGPRYPMASPPPQYYDPAPMVDPMIVEPNPIASIATAIAAEVVVDTVIGAVDGAFDPGPADFGGVDPGFGGGGSGIGSSGGSGF